MQIHLKLSIDHRARAGSCSQGHLRRICHGGHTKLVQNAIERLEQMTPARDPKQQFAQATPFEINVLG